VQKVGKKRGSHDISLTNFTSGKDLDAILRLVKQLSESVNKIFTFKLFSRVLLAGKREFRKNYRARTDGQGHVPTQGILQGTIIYFLFQGLGFSPRSAPPHSTVKYSGLKEPGNMQQIRFTA